MFKRFLASLAALLVLPTVALAAYQPGAVVQLPSVAALQGGNYINTPQIQLGGYFAGSSGGQGPLVNVAAPSPTATGSTANNSNVLTITSGNPVTQNWRAGEPITDSGTVIPTGTYIVSITSSSVTISQTVTGRLTTDTFTVACANGGSQFSDGGGNCFARTDFGVKGVVDARQCGVKGIGLANDDYAALTTCLNLAGALSFPNVSTGGGQVYDNTANIVIPFGVTLDCGLGDPTTIEPNSDFTLASGFTHVIAYPSAYSITGTNLGNISLTNCNLERTDGPYAPATFAPTSLRGSLNEVAAFSGVAVNDGVPSFTVNNVFAFGFGICFQTSHGNKRARFFSSGGHCNVGMNLGDNGDVLPIETMNFMPFLTRQNGTASQNQWQIDNLFNDGSGRYRIVAEIPNSDIVILAGDQFAYQAGLNTGTQSAAQIWTAGTPVTISNGTDGCLATQCQEFTLLGALGAPDSQDSQPSDGTPLSVTASWTVGAQGNALQITGGSVANISTGQTVTQVGGCGAVPVGTTIKDVWVAQGILFLTNPLTCGSSGTLSIADANFVYTPNREDIVISAVHNNGDCITTVGTSGLKGLNLHCFGHTVNFDCLDNTGNFSIVNFDVGSDESYYDPRVTGVYIGGKHVGQDCKGGTITSGVLAQHATTSVVIDSDGSGGTPTFSINSASAGPSTGKITGTILDVEAGQVVLGGSFGGTKANIFVSAGTTFRNLYPANSDASANYQVGNILTGNDSGCTTQPQVTVTAVAGGGVLDAEGLTQTRIGVCSPWPATFSGSTLTCANGTGSGCGTGAVLTTDGLIPADASINGSDFQQADLYPQTQATATNHLRGCGNYPVLSAIYSSLGPCIGTSVTAFTPQGATTQTSLEAFGDRALSLLDFGGTPDCSTSDSAALALAQTAAAAQGVHIIRLDGTSVGSCYTFGNTTLNPGIELLCPGPPAAEPANNDYRNFANTISITQSQGITLSANAKISGCNIVSSAITSSAPPTTYQANQARTAAFSGTAIQFSGPGATVEQSMIVGFANCFKLKAKSANTLWIHDVQTDCLTGYNFVGAGGGGNIVVNNFVSAPFATRAGTGGPPNETYLPLSTITDNGAGLLRVNLSSACTTANCPIGGDEIWVANPTPYQSAQGGWMPTIINSSTIDLIGSDSSFLTGHTESNVVLTNGSNRITGISLTSINEIQPTQAVTGACIPGGAQVLNIERNLGVLWLGDSNRNPVAATCAATENITITDQATGITAISSIATVSGGTGYAVGDTLQPTGGTVYNGNDAILTVTAVDAVTGAITATPSITMPGLYTVCPPNGSGVTDTNGVGTGATFNFTCSGSVVLYANNRSGADFLIQAVNDVRVTNGNDLGHAICVDWEKNANGVKFDQVSCHDENQLQDQTHYGLVLNGAIATNGAVNQNSFCNGGIYYFGVAVLDASQSGTNLSSNVVCNNLLGGSKGGSGLQNTALDVVSPGGAKDDSLTFIGNYANIPGFLFIPNTIRSAQFAANDFPFSYLWGQDDTTYGLLSGAGNNFAAGSASVSPKSSALNTVTANPGGGQANATLIIADFARVNAVATAGDSVQLRPAVAGFAQTLYNSSTRAMQVFGNVGTADTINGLASNVGVPQAPGSVVRYTSTATGALAATVVAASGTGALCPVSQPCVWTAMNTFNLNTVTAPATTTPSAIETVGSDAGTGQNVEGNAQAGTMAYQGIRRDGTLASPTAVAVNEKDVSLSARAYDGATVPATSEAGYQCVTGENQTSSAHGHFCIALCTPNGSTTTQECWREDAINTTQESLKFYGNAPAVSGTGTPAIVAGSTDNAGEVTGGTLATSIVITFNVPKTNAPFCIVTPQTLVASFAYTLSTTAITITETATTGQKVDYTCVQH